MYVDRQDTSCADIKCGLLTRNVVYKRKRSAVLLNERAHFYETEVSLKYKVVRFLGTPF
jgi:hypothetical protein